MDYFERLESETHELYKIANEQKIAISATSEECNISVLKYMISSNSLDVNDDSNTTKNENEMNRKLIQTSGVPVSISSEKEVNTTINNSEIGNNKYISIYVESIDGDITHRYWLNAGKIGALELVDNAPWEDNEIVPGPEIYPDRSKSRK